jgi:hypothetical protein
MAGLDPATQVSSNRGSNSTLTSLFKFLWVAGSSPAMTKVGK